MFYEESNKLHYGEWSYQFIHQIELVSFQNNCCLVVDSDAQLFCFLFHSDDTHKCTITHKFDAKHRFKLAKILFYPKWTLYLIEESHRGIHKLVIDETSHTVISCKRYTWSRNLNLDHEVHRVRDLTIVDSNTLALLKEDYEFNSNVVERQNVTINLVTLILSEKGRCEKGPFEIRNMASDVRYLDSIGQALIIIADSNVCLYNEKGKITGQQIPDSLPTRDLVLLRRESFLNSSSLVSRLVQFVTISTTGVLTLLSVVRDTKGHRHSYTVTAKKIVESGVSGTLTSVKIDSNKYQVTISNEGSINKRLELTFNKTQLVKQAVSFSVPQDQENTELSAKFIDKVAHSMVNSKGETVCCSNESKPFLNVGQRGYRFLPDTEFQVPEIEGMPDSFSIQLADELITILSYSDSVRLLSPKIEALNDLICKIKAPIISTHVVTQSDFIIVTSNSITGIRKHGFGKYSIAMSFSLSETAISFSEYDTRNRVLYIITLENLRKLRIGTEDIIDTGIDRVLKREISSSFLFKDILFLASWLDNKVTCYDQEMLEEIGEIRLDKPVGSMAVVSRDNILYFVAGLASGKLYAVPFVRGTKLTFNTDKSQEIRTASLPLKLVSISLETLFAYSNNSVVVSIQDGKLEVLPVIVRSSDVPGVILSAAILRKYEQVLLQIQNNDNCRFHKMFLGDVRTRWIRAAIEPKTNWKSTTIQAGYCSKFSIYVTLLHETSGSVSNSRIEFHVMKRNNLQQIFSLPLREALRISSSIVARGFTIVEGTESVSLVLLCYIGQKEAELLLFVIKKSESPQEVSFFVDHINAIRLGPIQYDNSNYSLLSGNAIQSCWNCIAFVFNNRVNIWRLDQTQFTMKKLLSLRIWNHIRIENDPARVTDQFLSKASELYASLHFPIARIHVFPAAAAISSFYIVCSSLVGGIRLFLFKVVDDKPTYVEIASECVGVENETTITLKPIALYIEMKNDQKELHLVDQADGQLKRFALEHITYSSDTSSSTHVTIVESSDDSDRFTESDGIDFVLSTLNSSISQAASDKETMRATVHKPTHKLVLIR